MIEFATHIHKLNPYNNSGERVSIITKLLDNGDGEVFYNQTISLESYGNSCEIKLFSAALTPDSLRQLATELEQLETAYLSTKSS